MLQPQYRLTPSLLDSFRLYYTADFMTLHELESRIKREPVTPTPAMLLGTAFHKIADGTAILCTGGFYEADGLYFDRTSVDDALRPLAGGISEVWCSRILSSVPHTPLLRGRVDRIVGAVPWEIKTKQEDYHDQKHIHKFIDMLQWQCYLFMLGVDECRYLLVRLEEGEDCWRVRDTDTLPLFQYHDMEDTINEWSHRLMRFCEDRDLLPYLALKER